MPLFSNVPRYKHFSSWKAAPCNQEGRSSLGIKATECWEIDSGYIIQGQIPVPPTASTFLWSVQLQKLSSSPFCIHNNGLSFSITYNQKHPKQKKQGVPFLNTILRNVMTHLWFSENTQQVRNVCPWCESPLEQGMLALMPHTWGNK